MHHAVMISSTFNDLKPLRKVLIDAALSAGLYPKVMEYNDGEVNASVLTNSLAMVNDSHAYVLLIGRRYGQRPASPSNPQNLSITELEFNEAIRSKKPVKLILLSDTYPTGVGDQLQTDIESLKAFRQRARTLDGNTGEHRIYKVVNTKQELSDAARDAMRDLADHLRKQQSPPVADPTPSLAPASAFSQTDRTGATRLQSALLKRIDEIQRTGTAEEQRLLSLLPQCASRAMLDAFLNAENGGLKFLARVRYHAPELCKTHLTESLAHSLALMFLVGAERFLQQKIGSLPTGALQLAVDSHTFGCVLGACLRNCGVHLALDMAKGELRASNVIADLPMAEFGQSQATPLLKELDLLERNLTGRPLDGPRTTPTEEFMAANLDALAEEKNLRLALGLANERMAHLRSDPDAAALLQKLDLDVIQFGSGDGLDLRETEQQLKQHLRDILPFVSAS